MENSTQALIKNKSVVVIVAHPDDETLWAGGTILSNPQNNWYVICLCRASDNERSGRFYKAMKFLNAKGRMGDLNDGPEQFPLNENDVEKEILRLLPERFFDIIITHNATGEYTKHLRHEEVYKAVISLYRNNVILANELWTFAYEDGNKSYYPRIVENASILVPLTEKTWNNKYKIITELYGFNSESWEAKTTPRTEAFWFLNVFQSQNKAIKSFIDVIRKAEISIFRLLGNRYY